MIKINLDYKIKDDLDFLEGLEKRSNYELSSLIYVSRISLDDIDNSKKQDYELLDKIYSYIYKIGYRLNKIKAEFLLESYPLVLFHGSKYGLLEIDENGSKDNSDFGNGFYLGENYEQALSFVSNKDKSSVYSFLCNLESLKIKKFNTSLEWMLAICYYRNTLLEYKDSELIKKIIKEIDSCDLIIAPIADNRMYYIMTLFSDGMISSECALHSLSASSLGFQYVFKTKKAINKLVPIERYFLSSIEKLENKKKLIERGLEIDTKLKLAQREYREGKYIEEVLKCED